MGRTAPRSAPSPSPSPSLSDCVSYFFRTLPHPDLVYYRGSVGCILVAYFLSLCIFFPRVLESDPPIAWWALYWGTPCALATLITAIALRFIDPGTVTKRRVEDGSSAPSEPRSNGHSTATTSELSHRSTASSASSSASSASSPSPSPAVCRHCHTVHLVRTVYCRRCEVCVRRYDHHCVMVDLCIGESNYRFFLLAVLLVTVTSAIAARLAYATLQSILAQHPLYHPRSLLALVTHLALTYMAAIAAFYFTFHIVGLLYTERTMKEAFNRGKEGRKKATWGCGGGKWGRIAKDLGRLLSGEVRIRELKEKHEKAYEEREEDEGWKDGDDFIGCVPEGEPLPLRPVA